METVKKPFQGVWNIIRFNWHYFVLSIITIVTLLVLRNNLPAALRTPVMISVLLIIIAILVSLSTSYYIYDRSSLYKLTWLDSLHIGDKILNINAGLDEISKLLQRTFPDKELTVLDFYDAAKHTELSIRRARKAFPPFPNTLQTSTSDLLLPDNSVDNIFLFLSAHEIRNDEERVSFFKELNRVLMPKGQIIVTEHLRDAVNFGAYNIGFFHFHSKATWVKTFEKAGLSGTQEIKITPFITTFILDKNGTAS